MQLFLLYSVNKNLKITSLFKITFKIISEKHLIHNSRSKLLTFKLKSYIGSS